MSEGPWWKKAKIYELYVDKFAGTFKGLTERLPYFEYLGINTLHILPHYPSPMVDDGYDISDYRGVRPELGTLEDFSVFVETAHSSGIKVITDLVINHVSSQHHWFVAARASASDPKRTYFLWSKTGTEFKSAANPFVDFKPSNWIWNEPTKDYYYATFYPEQPDLNWDNPDVMREILDRMDFWVARGVDGFRIDAIPHLIEREGTTSFGLPETHAIIREIRGHLEERYQGRIILLAEVSAAAEEARPYFGVGDECHLAYHFPLAARMLLALARGDEASVTKTVESTFDIPQNCEWAVFLRNHDDVSMASLSEEERSELVHFLDPKHQYPFKKGKTVAVRLATAFGGDAQALARAFALLYSLPGVPVMYYGDEIGMQNMPANSRFADSRKYVRGAFDWTVAERMMKEPDSLLSQVAGYIRRRT